jgi:hypothetical protein
MKHTSGIEHVTPVEIAPFVNISVEGVVVIAGRVDTRR